MEANKVVTKDSAFQGVLMNSIGWELFHDDGREVVTYDDGNQMIVLNESELERCRLATLRVLGDLQGGH